jgi:hypothetical protein
MPPEDIADNSLCREFVKNSPEVAVADHSGRESVEVTTCVNK